MTPKCRRCACADQLPGTADRCERLAAGWAYPMRFQLYSGASGGTQWWDSGHTSVAVDDGLFNAALDVIAPVFDGPILWLRIYVNGEWLSPRQALLPRLRPQPAPRRRDCRGNPTHPATCCVWRWRARTPRGQRSGATPPRRRCARHPAGGYGLAGYTDDGYAVRGLDPGTTQARGYGGTSAAPMASVSTAQQRTHDRQQRLCAGRLGPRQNGVGVYGLSDTSRAGVYGEHLKLWRLRSQQHRRRRLRLQQQ
jgi:hypothetical protein